MTTVYALKIQSRFRCETRKLKLFESTTEKTLSGNGSDWLLQL